MIATGWPAASLPATCGSDPTDCAPPFGGRHGTRLKISLADLATCLTLSIARVARLFWRRIGRIDSGDGAGVPGCGAARLRGFAASDFAASDLAPSDSAACWIAGGLAARGQHQRRRQQHQRGVASGEKRRCGKRAAKLINAVILSSAGPDRDARR